MLVLVLVAGRTSMPYRDTEEAVHARESVPGGIAVVEPETVPAAVTVHLRGGQPILWRGRPARRTVVRRYLPVAGLGIVGLGANAASPPLVMFGLIGGLALGGSIVAAWLALRRTHYVVTEREILIVEGKDARRLYGSMLSDVGVRETSRAHGDVLFSVHGEVVARFRDVDDPERIAEIVRGRFLRPHA